MKPSQTTTRRDFFNRFLRDAIRLTQDVKQSCKAGMREADILDTFEDYPIAQTYPRELFEEEAKRLGIDIDALGETEAIRRITAIQMDRGNA